ncbi:hypothetical protein OG785_03300 [Streptomyces sp. NBC_00006]|uniref:hypothetical protein n=1 Tax=Streptomyces sp. NBC_00006 TaxID=2975619 RepID=UPI00225727AE|nr:hypothetical protein [Streptomyces sp. NBC_00006]MCX5529600.1 hypothetical protein [Streptomyces sp. NBC_00006]
MRHRTRADRDDAGTHPTHSEPASRAADVHWVGEARGAFGYALTLFGLLLLIDTFSGQLDLWRGLLWLCIGTLLGTVLMPPRVSATTDRLVSRGLLREHSVRTDRLVSVRCLDGVARRLVLRDEFGGRVEIDPQVLTANPPLWRLVDDAARVSVEQGLLLCGETALRKLARQVDAELARTIFRVSDFT